MLNRTYNNIIRIIGFVYTMALLALMILGIVVKPWWYVLIPIVITYLFSGKKEERIYMVNRTEDIEDIENGEYSEDSDDDDDDFSDSESSVV